MRKQPDHPEIKRQMEQMAQLIGEEMQEKKPSRLSMLLRRIGLAVLVIVALVFAYLFLLLGEPDEDAKYVQQVQEESSS